MEQLGVIIVAGGTGTRMGGGTLPKQFRLLDGRPVLARSIDRFAEALPGAEIVVVLPEAHIAFWENWRARFGVAKHTVVAGGQERFHSVRNGLAALSAACDRIAVHDGVRPLASADLLRRTARCAEQHGSAIPVVPVVDSLREVDADGSRPADRSRLRAVQTPQVFQAALLRQAYERGYDPAFTDDASVVEASGAAVTLCEGEPMNLKITTSGDLELAGALLRLQRERAEEAEEAAAEEAGEGAAETAEAAATATSAE